LVTELTFFIQYTWLPNITNYDKTLLVCAKWKLVISFISSGGLLFRRSPWDGLNSYKLTIPPRLKVITQAHFYNWQFNKIAIGVKPSIQSCCWIVQENQRVHNWLICILRHLFHGTEYLSANQYHLHDPAVWLSIGGLTVITLYTTKQKRNLLRRVTVGSWT